MRQFELAIMNFASARKDALPDSLENLPAVPLGSTKSQIVGWPLHIAIMAYTENETMRSLYKGTTAPLSNYQFELFNCPSDPSLEVAEKNPWALNQAERLTSRTGCFFLENQILQKSAMALPTQLLWRRVTPELCSLVRLWL